MKTQRILIADDSEVLNMFYTKILAPHFPQHCFCIVTNGGEALDAVRRTQYDLIITDLSMPILEGDELYSLILKMSAEEPRKMPPFIFCSGVKQALDDVRATCSGKLNRFMLKPFRWHELQDAITEALASDSGFTAQEL